MSGATITIHGNLGKAPEVRQTGSGLDVADFTLAVNHFKGQGKEPTTSWFRVTVWGKQIETIRDWQKGDYAIVSGDFEAREFQGNDGQKRTSLDVNARSLSNISKMMRAKGSGQQGHAGEDAGGWSEAPSAPRSSSGAPAPPKRAAQPPTEDDLPF